MNRHIYLLLLTLIIAACNPAAAPQAATHPATPVLSTGSAPVSPTAPSPTSVPSVSPTNPPAATMISSTPTETPAAPAIAPTVDPSRPILDIAYTDRLLVLTDKYDIQPNQSTLTGQTLFVSPDGGQTWEAHPVPYFGNENIARRIAFQSAQVGWLYDPGLLFTKDGGKTWATIPVDQKIEDVLPADTPDGPAWALTNSCKESSADCLYHLVALDPQTGALQPLPGYLPVRGGEFAQLLRISAANPGTATSGATALIFAPQFSTESQPNYHFILWFSNGGGMGWTRRDTPCTVAGLLSIPPSGDYWLLCGDLPSAGNQTKGMYLSTDQGRTWQLRSASDFFNQPTPEPTPSGVTSPLQTYGYLDSLLALSPQEALVGLARFGMIRSSDGGLNWQAVIPDEAVNGESYWGFRMTRGAGEGELWAAMGSFLLRSSDRGQTWSLVNVPQQ